MKNLFLDVEFPKGSCIFEKQLIEFFTVVQTSKNGFENRIILNEFGRSKYFLEDCIMHKAKITEICNFFKLVRGRGYSFRFFDDIDFRGTNEKIEFLQNGEFILTRTYKVGKEEFRKFITKPKPKSLILKFGDALLEEEVDFKIDYSSGILRFLTRKLQENAFQIRAFFEFDIEVRFDADELKIVKDKFGNMALKDLILTEVV